MKNTYRTNEELKKYFNKSLYQIKTSLRKGEVKTNVKKVLVYNPLDFSKRIAPCSGCDIVINNDSTNSDYIFDLKKGLNTSTSAFSLHRYKEINIFTFCEESQVKEVTKLHLLEIKNGIEEVKKDLKKEIEELNKIKF